MALRPGDRRPAGRHRRLDDRHLIEEFGFPVPLPPELEASQRRALGVSTQRRQGALHLAARLLHRCRAVDHDIGGGELLLLRRLAGEPAARGLLVHAARPGRAGGSRRPRRSGRPRPASQASASGDSSSLMTSTAATSTPPCSSSASRARIAPRTRGCRIASRSRRASGSEKTIVAELGGLVRAEAAHDLGARVRSRCGGSRGRRHRHRRSPLPGRAASQPRCSFRSRCCRSGRSPSWPRPMLSAPADSAGRSACCAGRRRCG